MIGVPYYYIEVCLRCKFELQDNEMQTILKLTQVITLYNY